LIIESLFTFIPVRQTKISEIEFTEMASDADVQRELSEIEIEFAETLLDGLSEEMEGKYSFSRKSGGKTFFDNT
jgi:hypothetical protein